MTHLLKLPLDLKLHLAEFFAPDEATSALLVNREFHAIFSRAVWHSLDTRRLTNSRRAIPYDALKHYGLLIRRPDISDAVVNLCELAELIPNITTVIYGKRSSFPGHAANSHLSTLAALQNLQTAHLYVQHSSHLMIDDYIAWINDSARSGHARRISIHLVLSNHTRSALEAMIRDIKDWRRLRLRVNISTADTPPIEHLVAVSRYVRDYHFFAFGPLSECPRSKMVRLIDNQEACFMRVTALSLVLCCCNSKSSREFEGFEPLRFPVLRWLQVEVKVGKCGDHRRNDSRNDNGNSSVRRLFAHRWPHLASLCVKGCITAADMKCIVAATPAIHLLHYESKVCQFDLAFVLSRLANLKSLSVRGKMNNESSRAILAHHSRLNHLRLIDCDITVDAMMFIMRGCPSLRRLHFDSCTLTDDAVTHVANCINNKGTPSGVRSLTLVVDPLKDIAEEWMDVISAFPDIKEVLVGNVLIHINQIKQRYPHLRVA
ncbi:hypothetical protein GQ42DRAFT_163961 [Ramicandelaber brevisporus]|nr:hypothetical protein GQ42DRAFT_163961 [Ramicandelaber brevisporus]